MKRPLRAHIVALIASFVTILAVSALWIVNLRMGPELDGFTGGAMLVYVPFAILIVTGVFLLVRALLHHRIKWRAVTVVITSIAFALWPAILYCGPVECFAPGRNHLMGWFIIAGVALAALVHHVVLDRFPAEAAHAAHRA